MTFAVGLNNLVLIFSFTLLLFIFIGIRLGIARGGWNRHLPFSFTLVIYFVYIYVTPLYYYQNEITTIIGTDITKYFGAGFFYNNLAVCSFIFGYWIKGGNKNVVWESPVNKHMSPKKIQQYIGLLFYGCYAIVLLNLAAGGASLGAVFLGDQSLGLGASGASYFLQNFTDSLISLIVLGYLFNVRPALLLVWILAAFFLFSLLGFRYRIMLSLFGILFVYLYKNKVDLQRLAIGLFMALIFFYGIMFSTENRRILIDRNYERLKFDPLNFEYENFFFQTRGGMADMAIYKLYDNPNKVATHDYGLTMFGYVFIRMIPRAIYPNKDDLYPPPQLATTLQAYDAWWAKQAGEATLSVGAFYIAFGWLGVILGHFFWGVLLRRFGDQIHKNDVLQLAVYIVVSLITFQWVTRGYFPQVIDHFVYMMIPVWVLRYLYKKNKLVENN
jgi:uncharacterized membrane protein YozB (DUF420 family)